MMRQLSGVSYLLPLRISKREKRSFPRIDVDAEIEELNQLIPNPAALRQKEEARKHKKTEGNRPTFDGITFEDFVKS